MFKSSRALALAQATKSRVCSVFAPATSSLLPLHILTTHTDQCQHHILDSTAGLGLHPVSHRTRTWYSAPLKICVSDASSRASTSPANPTPRLSSTVSTRDDYSVHDSSKARGLVASTPSSRTRQSIAITADGGYSSGIACGAAATRRQHSYHDSYRTQITRPVRTSIPVCQSRSRRFVREQFPELRSLTTITTTVTGIFAIPTSAAVRSKPRPRYAVSKSARERAHTAFVCGLFERQSG
jgi:hypothetical protein